MSFTVNNYKIKLALSNNKEFSLKEKLMLRPIFPTNDKITFVDDPYEADFILINSTSGNSKNNYNNAKKLSYFNDLEDKFLIYINDDNPDFAYDGSRVNKLVSQPLYGRNKNIEHNIIPIPLVMSDHYFIDDDFIKQCRSNKKEFDFCFIGNTNIYGRDIFKRLDFRPKTYLFKDTSNLNIYSINNHNDKLIKIKQFLLDISKCKYVFCPRGQGSSSFRLYETMMVGSVPIISGMNDYPFTNFIDWNNLAYFTDLKPDKIKQTVNSINDNILNDKINECIKIYDTLIKNFKLNSFILNFLKNKINP